VQAAQGMLWSSPLYHGTISGAFKNALDWLQLLSDRNPPYLTDKVVGLISTAGGTHGLQAVNTMEFVVRALRGWAVPLVLPIPQAWQVFKDASVAKGGRVPERTHGKYLLSGGMLVCPTCGANFEMVKSPWKPGGEYICSTRRRKPGVCSNTLALPMAQTDDIVLSVVEAIALDPDTIEELLSLVDKGEVDQTDRLTADRDRLQQEIANLVSSIAAGVPATTVAPAIKIRESEIAKLERQLNAPRPMAPNIEKLRAAMTHRAAEWTRDLRGDTSIARMVLRRLIGPLTLYNPAKKSAEWIEWDAAFTSG